VIDTIANDPTLAGLIRRLKSRGGIAGASGLWGSSAPMVAASVHEALQRPLLYITAHLDEADDMLEDIEFFLQKRCSILPAWETLPGEGGASSEVEAERLRLCGQLLQAPNRAVEANEETNLIVAPIQALMQPVPTAAALRANTLHLKVGGTGDPASTGEWLTVRGYSRLERIETPGDYARRGDILDIFIPGENDPVRIVFLDDRVESIRRFDVSSQRSLVTLESTSVTAVAQPTKANPADVTDFLTYLPQETLVVLDEAGEIQEMGGVFWDRLDRPDRLHDIEKILRRVGRFDQLHVNRLGAAAMGEDDSFHFDVGSVARFDGKSAQAVDELCAALDDHHVQVVCENESQRQRLAELLTERMGEVPASLEITQGMVHRGFEWTACRTIVVGHHELFGRLLQRRRVRRVHATRAVESWLDLEPGDYVVHSLHGIARFREIKTMAKEGSRKREEFLTLVFAGQAVLHVPVSQIDLVQKYIGAGDLRPALSKLGGTRWSKTKEKVGEAVAELAESLIRIQAMRQATEGTAYPADTTWQHEFEGSFRYQETEDQIIVGDEIKGDLRQSRPMDRLLCGDVGFGKTELAARAAFKVVEYGRQVAILVPTTVLAEQHYRTFTERFAEYPFLIGCLSRFRTAKEQRQLIERAKRGQVDIIIGTHRLLSKDVGFANLGLIIIDEEQRFGVEHKEKLKTMRELVEVLTMTATPIPRTLHMAMIGIRDISSLATPPADRRAIATQVRAFDEGLIRSAILRELNREGQVFFLHNRVQSIQTMADTIQRIVPEARVVVGHGQMKEGALSKVMTTFVRHEADVLVATTIIESGIDIPNANTIFINDADRFGLADLHQLRGRVGRSHHRGYCYLLLPTKRPITPKATKRLKAVEEFSELGAGFRIAMRDLEIRGAGNVLGPEQSGHIASVGYEMYCQLLERTVRNLRGEPDLTPTPVHLELDVTAQIPKHYISAARSRIDIYRRLVSCHVIEDVKQLEGDLNDMFGQPPDAVERLMELAELRILARRWRIQSIILQRPDVVFRLSSPRSATEALADGPGSVQMPDPHTAHLRLPANYLEPGTLLPVIRRLLSRAQPPESGAKDDATDASPTGVVVRSDSAREPGRIGQKVPASVGHERSTRRN